MASLRFRQGLHASAHSVRRPRAGATLAIGVIAAIWAVSLPKPAAADGGGDPTLPICFAPQAGFTQVAFPPGQVPPHLPYPQAHQLTDEYIGLGILFSDDDSDMPPTHQKYSLEPDTYNVVRQSTLYTVYRIDFVGDNVREVKMLLRDANMGQTTHRLTAFSATGAPLSTSQTNDPAVYTNYPFFLSVTSPGTPIKSVVFTQQSWGQPTLDPTVLTCLEFGAVPPTNTPAPTATPTLTFTPDPAGSATPTPSPVCQPAVVTADADAWFEQSSSANKGDDSSLKVQSKSGNDAFRAILRFPLPPPPPGCELDTATLRIYAESAKPGRIIQAQRAAAAWGEMSVNWTNQPNRVGPISSADSGVTAGWRYWTVTAQVVEMYGSGTAHGFVLFDQVEDEDSEQTYRSREHSSNRPTLALTFRPGSSPPPPTSTATRTAVPTSTSAPAATATHTSTRTETPIPAATSTLTPSRTATSPAVATATRTPTATRTSTFTRTATRTRTPTQAAGQPTATRTSTFTAQPIATATPGSPCSTVSLTASADAWFEQSSDVNKGDDSSLKVQSKSGNDAFRAIVRFSLPSVPAGCALGAAELRLYADSAKPGRTIQVQSAASAWGEMTINWSNQPARVGAISSTASGADPGWRVWGVTEQVAAMYASGAAHGFVVFDQVENQDSEQTYSSRESGSNRPTLVLTFDPL